MISVISAVADPSAPSQAPEPEMVRPLLQMLPRETPNLSKKEKKVLKQSNFLFGHGRTKTLKSVGFPVNLEAHGIWFI